MGGAGNSDSSFDWPKRFEYLSKIAMNYAGLEFFSSRYEQPHPIILIIIL